MSCAENRAVAAFVDTTAVFDTTAASIFGWSGWMVPLLLVIVLVAAKGFRPPPMRTPRTSPAVDQEARQHPST